MPRLFIDGRTLTVSPKGVGRYTYHLCCEVSKLLSADWEIYILVLDIPLPLFPENFRAKFIYVPAGSELKAGLYLIPKQLKSLQAQILLNPLEGIGGSYGIPAITVCHDIYELIAEAQISQGAAVPGLFRGIVDKIKNLYMRRGLRNSEYVLCNSQFIRKAVCDYYGVDYLKTELAYCGVDLRFYELSKIVNIDDVKNRYGVSNYILTFATGDYRENFLRLPGVIKQTIKLGVDTTFIVAGIRGKPEYKDKLQLEFNRLDLIEGKHYIFESFFGEDRFAELVELYTAADFYLELSLHEGFGMQVAEAMACGATCISSGKGALTEVSGGFALLIENPLNESLIAEQIKIAYKNKLHLRNNEEQISYTRKFSWESVGIKVTECLLAIAEKYGLDKV